MAVKELKLDSIVTEANSTIIKSLKIVLSYADNSSKSSQFSLDDTICVKAIKKGNLATFIGRVTKINDNEDNQYFVLDLSETSQTYTEKFYIPEIRDISNLSCPMYDEERDAEGNLITPEEPEIPDEDKDPIEPDNGTETPDKGEEGDLTEKEPSEENKEPVEGEVPETPNEGEEGDSTEKEPSEENKEPVEGEVTETPNEGGESGSTDETV